MNIPKIYDPSSTQEKWYSYWMEKEYFYSKPDDREPYTIVMPPPNVTGVLHMGHMLNNTIQDVLIRRARMLGKNACWVPGTDHASIATEAKVVQKLKSEGIQKSDLSREEFLKHAFEWKDKHGNIILEQLKKLGASCDWKRTYFTLDEDYSESVIEVFIDLFKKGEIYKGVRMVNWDPVAKTAVSDEEVIYKEVNSKLFFLRYKLVGTSDKWLTIATTRPETILGDTAVCVNPNDIRYKAYIGKTVIVPISNREIPVICDDYVDPEFGTGCLKITPAHDINDYEIGLKHNIESIDIFNVDGTLNNHGLHYKDIDRMEVRKLIENELNEKGYLVKVEDYLNKVGFSERTNAIIEPKLSLQWFLRMKKLGVPALENVMNGQIAFHPDKFKNTYRHWMENIKDWCISRQLWWGHRIPAWYYGSGMSDFVVAASKQEAITLIKEKTNQKIDEDEIFQDEDVLDTWFSSWLWPISVFQGISKPKNADIQYYYPTNDLVTAPEIMFFWVARMIMSGYEYKNALPFKNVYFTGIVRDKLGRKMSKSLGNSPDPIELIDNYGADGVRVGVLISSPAGNDLPFDSSQCEQGRNFTNKIWNAYRLISSWEVKDFAQPNYCQSAIHWFESRFNEVLLEVNNSFDKFRISEALMHIYKLVWDDFCSWYLEIIKPGFEQPIDSNTKKQTICFFENLLKIMHPILPFITEELWHLIDKRENGNDIIVSSWPSVDIINNNTLSAFNLMKEVIVGIRNVRKKLNISNKVKLELEIKLNEDYYKNLDATIIKLGNLSSINYVNELQKNSSSFIINSNEFNVLFGGEIDMSEERKKIEEELNYLKGFLASVQAKLKNERFIKSAPPQVVRKEQDKESDASGKIEVLQKRLKELG